MTATDSTPSTGCTGANTFRAPETPIAATISLLQLGQPTARNDRTPPAVAAL